MRAAELLEQLNVLDEHERVEAKRASEVGKSLLETVCAFANEPGMDGGWILLGVKKEDLALFPAYEVEGVGHPDKLCADLASQCRTTFNTPVQVDISTEQLTDKVVVVVRVLEASAQSKPIFFRAKGLPQGAFRRVGSTDQHCTEDDLSLLYQGRQTETFDTQPMVGTSLEDVSAEALADYRQTRAEAYPDAEELRWSDEQLLESLGCIKRVDGAWALTLSGLLLFGRPQALRRRVPMTRVDYIRVPGREWVPDPDSRFDTIELRDPLFRLIRRAQAAVLDDLPKGFGLAEGELQRQEKPVIPLRVIREAIVNAVMHRSYRVDSPIQIIRYANRLEIRNPGFSLKPPEHLGEPGSRPRNPCLAAVLHETRFAETKGSGIRVMREMMRQAGLTPPLFESDRGRNEFVARYLFHHFLGPEDVKWLSRFKSLSLADDDAKALVFVKEAGAIDNASYRELTGLDTLAASQALRRLRDAGLLVQRGKGSATYYVPSDSLLPEIEGGLTSNPSPLSSNPPSLSSNPRGALGSQSTARKNPSDSSTREALLKQVPGNIAARLGGLGQRNSPDAVRDIVLELCLQRAWRAEELALLLQRNTEYVRSNYLRPLLRSGQLTMTNPSDVNDPQQAYRTALAG
jgi:ATP-dependent DNA helicase RecG